MVANEIEQALLVIQAQCENADDMGGIVMPLDDALEFIAKEGTFWTWV